jgi:hypothetical protein
MENSINVFRGQFDRKVIVPLSSGIEEIKYSEFLQFFYNEYSEGGEYFIDFYNNNPFRFAVYQYDNISDQSHIVDDSFGFGFENYSMAHLCMLFALDSVYRKSNSWLRCYDSWQQFEASA